MYRLSFVILFVVLFQRASTQSTHGVDFKVDCKECHTSSSWKIDLSKFTYNHDTTGFPLEGMHKKTDCKACHKSLLFKETKNTCVACHTDVHGMTVGNDCARCHTAKTWLVDNLPELHEQNGFPLKGGHRILACVDCHKSDNNLKFERIGNECISCHQKDYANTKEPNHLSSGFSTNCITCHDPETNDWKGAGFMHDQFPLVQAHAIPDCKVCHKGANYKDISSACVSCHKLDFDRSTAPPHVGSGYSTNCIECHSPSPVNWIVPEYHNSFPLTQGHKVNDCKECHKTNNYPATSTECVSCHLPDFNASTAPPHVGSGYSTNCITCHSATPINWKVPGYHNSFPLTNGHNVSDCKTCHKTNNYPATSTDCFSCHQTDFTNSTAPPHVGSGFSTNCIDCHAPTPINWNISGYHNSFPLTLGHNIVDCKACHKTSNYPSTSAACYSCHVTDYDNVISPNHKTNNFSTNCTECHTTAPGWNATNYLMHDAAFFPINSGKHQGEWNLCSDCHTTAGNYKLFTCITCHEHNSATRAANDHKGVSGYSYTATSCFTCHPKGKK